MYTAEEKAAVIRLCKEYGIKEASKLTGVSQHSMYTWCREAKRNALVANDSSGLRSSAKYSASKRLETLRLSEEIGVMQASKKTGVPYSTIYKWRVWAKQHAVQITGNQSMIIKAQQSDLMTGEKDRVIRLRNKARRTEVSSQSRIDKNTSHPSDGLRIWPRKDYQP